MKIIKNIPKEWLILIIIVLLTLGIGIFQWNQTNPVSQNSGQDTSGVILNEVKGSPDGGGIQKLEKGEGNVTVLVEYLAEKSNKSNMVFRIALDTHSVDLDSFDFRKDINLEKDGQSFPPQLVSQEGSGHHRSAEITFPITSTPFNIVVKNLSNIPRREFSFEKL